MVELRNRSDGFTIIELLVAVAIGLIVMSAIYSTYRSQQKSYILQEQVAAMQQNLRAALYYMARDIRMAGCDPTGVARAGITAATPTSISFTRDIRGNDPASTTADGDTGDTDESITYSLYDAYSDSVTDLGRNSTGTLQPLALNIDWLDFVYLDQNGNVTTTLGNIRSVQITIVARTGRGDLGYVNKDVFYNQQGTEIYRVPAPGDSFHRKRLTTHIRCRNL